MKTSEYRALMPDEIAVLEAQRCTCGDWSSVLVSTAFSADRVWDTCFSGEIRLGSFRNTYRDPGGVPHPAGVYRARLHNVTVGDECRIADVSGYIANYHLAKSVRIERIESLYVESATTFGNGTRVAVLNEAGGREVTLYEELSAQTAYLQCTFRQEEALQESLQKIAASYAASKIGTCGQVDFSAEIRNCGRLCNISVGEGAVIDGAEELEEGTVCSELGSPARMGRGVTARQFILRPGARVLDGARLTRCFVGEASCVANGFTATDTLIFANCHFENGEACALFAGPYTVSHHKSTLLIGAMTSFMNAGSATNQSNHAYKLGPVHYGILERGCRTGSGSYLLWPARIGAFSTILGTVKAHIDTSSLPFSYVIGEGSKTFLVPGATLRSIGCWRDEDKWPKRDGRKTEHPTDVIHTPMFTPYTVSKMLQGITQLRKLKEEQGKGLAEYTFQGAVIRASSLKRGITQYEQAARYWAGTVLLSALHEGGEVEYTADRLLPSDWVDVAGALLVREDLNAIIQKIVSGPLTSPQDICNAFNEAGQPEYARKYSLRMALHSDIWGKTLLSIEDIKTALTNWKQDALAYLDSVIADGEKEFAPLMRVSSGIDALGEEEKQQDFERSGGCASSYPFLSVLEEKKESIANRIP